jgi:hypothetical protein
VKRRRRRADDDSSPSAAWSTWVAANMQQKERDLSPHEESAPSALILLPLLGLPALLVVGLILTFVLK